MTIETHPDGRRQCPWCLEWFNSARAFTQHRVGAHTATRQCLPPEEMRTKGMRVGKRGFWMCAK